MSWRLRRPPRVRARARWRHVLAELVPALVLLGAASVTLPGVATGAVAPGQPMWQQRIGTSASPAAFFSVATGPGGVVAVGGMSETASGEVLLVAEYAADGRELWARTYPTFAGDAKALAFDSQGSLYAGVELWGGNPNVAVVKLDGKGEVAWSDVYDHSGGWEWVTGVAVDADDNVALCGDSEMNGPNTGLYARKYDGAGTLLWGATYRPLTSTGLIQCRDMAVDPDGNVYVAGRSVSQGGEPNTTLVAKYAADDGARLWSDMFAGTSGTGAYLEGVAVRDGRLAACGGSGDTFFGDNSGLVMTYDAAGGERLGVRDWGAGDGLGEWFHDVALDGRGRVVVTGTKSGWSDDYWQKAVTVEFGPRLGTVLWSRAYLPRSRDALGWRVAIDEADAVYMAGQRETAVGHNDFLTAKYSAEGTRLWVRTPARSGPFPAVLWGLALGRGGGVYVTGRATTDGDVSQGVLRKYLD